MRPRGGPGCKRVCPEEVEIDGSAFGKPFQLRDSRERGSRKQCGREIDAGKQKYTNVRVPALGVYAVIDDPGSANMQDPEQRANAEAYQWFQQQRAARSIALFQRDLPHARVVRVERADHYVFLSNESEVLRQMNAFIATLSR